ncbi:sugar phosphate isomerase/epimerase [Cohnella sp. REN36]|uniref:sugar phosphate isomerase/epimerase family protein n=1 Tax=Cohnella sp. REN36 TaxID=2887347 RepID=UPI001D1556FC|nr:TIM barrel protein [Cohnella sp. REN36]MCC3377356.1 sugar phosphate isomerase/epimerase [Cohnella sp. REN36]
MQYHVNSWSFGREMGPLQLIEWDDDGGKHVVQTEGTDPARMTLSELITRLGKQGYRGVELAYVHLRDMSEEGLRRLRDDAGQAGVELTSLLLDFGDPSSADEARRAAERDLYRRWIRAAEQAGFRRVRIGAGQASPEDEAAFDRAADMLRELADFAERGGIRLVTENLGRLLSRSDRVLKMLRACGGLRQLQDGEIPAVGGHPPASGDDPCQGVGGRRRPTRFDGFSQMRGAGPKDRLPRAVLADVSRR